MSVDERSVDVRPPAAPKTKAKKLDAALVGGGMLMVVCCAVGPAVIGAVAGSAVGGWLGIACAVIFAAVAGVVFHRRGRAC